MTYELIPDDNPTHDPDGDCGCDDCLALLEMDEADAAGDIERDRRAGL